MFQLYIQAVDGDGKRSNHTAIITINILRNIAGPRFVDSNTHTYQYSDTIVYTAPINTNVVLVSAVDNDLFNTITYSMRQYENYFSINPNSGQITLIGDLNDLDVRGITEFTVRQIIRILSFVLVL